MNLTNKYGLFNCKSRPIFCNCIHSFKPVTPNDVYNRAHPAISHCSHLLLKCGAATIISHWLKVHSRWFKNDTFAKKCILISFWSFQYFIAFIIPSHFIIVQYLTLWMLPSGCQTVWIQIRPDIMSGLIWVQTVCKCYQQMTKVTVSGQRVKYRATC